MRDHARGMQVIQPALHALAMRQWPMRGSSSALRAARARRGINDALLRRVSGLPASAWGQLTPGARQPGVARLLRLADAVDVAVDDLPDPGRPSG